MSSKVEVHIYAPDGPLLAAGESQGSADTGPWVSNGLTFYLQDVSNGFPLTSEHTIGQVTAQVTPQPESGYLLAMQNPLQATGVGSATLNWFTNTASTVEVHLGAPDGPLFTRGGPQGSATTGPWVTDGTVFYLQDVTNDAPLTPQFTIATQTLTFAPNAQASFQASPNPIPVAPGKTAGMATLYWNAPASASTLEVHLGTPDGPLFARGPNVGSAQTGPWVTEGTVFYLQDVTNNKPLTSANTLATLTMHVKQQPSSER
jgi:hypothetical protein